MKKHMCQSIEGALQNWTREDWRRVAKLNNAPTAYVKDQFRLWLREGKRVLPIGGQCEGFSFQTGCPGHED
jgi:hypothetical protein